MGTDPEGFLALYDVALPHVYGYLLSRCSDSGLAQDLTAETFLAALSDRAPDEVGIGWLVGVARHKLADHWRWQARQHRLVEDVGALVDEVEDPWEVHLDVLRAREVLARLGPHHRAALTLRYLDGQDVPAVAELLGRTVHATEALLVRARRAFRAAYHSPAPHQEVSSDA